MLRKRPLSQAGRASGPAKDAASARSAPTPHPASTHTPHFSSNSRPETELGPHGNLLCPHDLTLPHRDQAGE
jgi:hypothetical protein